MPSFNTNMKKILNNLDQNIKDKEDLEYIKVQIFNLYNMFFEELTKMEELASTRIAEVASLQSEMNDKINKMEHIVKSIEKDIYIDEEDSEDYDFEITCPYCNKEFTIELKNIKQEVICPECKNSIELDWTNECNSECNCSECDNNCHSEDEDM